MIRRIASLHIVIVLIACLALVSCTRTQIPLQKRLVSQALKDYYRAEELHRKGQLEEARDLYIASLQASPRPRVYFRLAQVQSELGEYNEALINCNQAIDQSHGFSQAEALKKQIEAKLSSNPNGTSQAPENPDRASLIHPIVVQVPLQGETGALSPSKPSQSEPSPEPKQPEPVVQVELEKPIALNTPGPIESEQLSEAKKAAKEGNWEQALSICDNALQSNSNDALAHYMRGYVCFHLDGHLSDAEKSLRRAVEIDPQHTDALNDLGVTLERLNRPLDAVDAYEKAIATGQKTDAYYNLALLKEKTGDYREAISLYQKYLELDKSSSFAKQAEERIRLLKRNAF